MSLVAARTRRRAGSPLLAAPSIIRRMDGAQEKATVFRAVGSRTRPSALASVPVALSVTNTWQGYNFGDGDGDMWYAVASIGSGKKPAHVYDFFAFPGHHEHVTEAEYDVVTHFRD